MTDEEFQKKINCDKDCKDLYLRASGLPHVAKPVKLNLRQKKELNQKMLEISIKNKNDSK